MKCFLALNQKVKIYIEYLHGVSSSLKPYSYIEIYRHYQSIQQIVISKFMIWEMYCQQLIKPVHLYMQETNQTLY